MKQFVRRSKNARNPKIFKNIYQRYAGDIV